MSVKLLESLPLKKLRERYDDIVKIIYPPRSISRVVYHIKSGTIENISLEQINKRYEKTFEIIKYLCYDNKILRTVKYDDTLINLYHEQQSSQYLTKLTCDKDFEIPLYVNIQQNGNIVTAFYFPKELKYAELWEDDILIAYYGSDNYQTLEDILEESKNLQYDETSLEHILYLSRQEQEQFTHNQEKEIYIDDILYKRVILLQPCINICSNSNYRFYLKIPPEYAKLSIYAESNTPEHRYLTYIKGIDTYYYAPSTNIIYLNATSLGNLQQIQ